MNQTRPIQDMEIMRVVATIAVIVIHSTSQHMTLSEVGYYGNQLARFAVPMFLILSGFLLAGRDLQRGLLPRALFYRRRFARILLPYVIWTIIYSLILHFYFNGAQNAHLILPDIFRHLLLGNGFTHLYFVVIIIQLYLLYPFIRGPFTTRPGAFLLLSLAVSLPCQYLLYQHAVQGLPFSPYMGEIFLIAFPVWIFYFCLGMYLAQKDFKLEMSGRLPWPAWLLIWLVSLGLLLGDSSQTASYGLSIKPTVMLYAVCSFLLLRALLNHYRIQSGPIITWLSAQSFLIYLLHPLLANFLVFLSLHLGRPDLWSSNSGALAKLLLTLILTLVSAAIILRTPLAKPLGGKGKRGTIV